MSNAQQIPQVPPWEYRDLRPVERARLANTDPARHRAEKEKWEAAGRPAARTITSAALVRAGWSHDGVAYREMTWPQRAKLSRENPQKYHALRRQWIESGRPGPETEFNGPPEAA